jgi:pyruvate,water dikinase
MDVSLSIGVQKMLRSDKACAEVCFTLGTETGFDKVMNNSGSWGLVKMS